MQRAYSYIRFSSGRQSKGRSLDRQLEMSRAWCDRNGYYLDDSLGLRDLGVSGFHGANATTGKLGAFLTACEEQQVRHGSVLIVESLDRLSRQDVSRALRLLLNILEYGVDVVTLEPEQRFSLSTIDERDLIVALVVMGRAHDESRTKSMRVRDAWRKKRQVITEGAKLSGRCPAWVRLSADGKRYVLIPERAKVVRKIFAWSIDGLGRASVAKRLNQEGIPTFNHVPHWGGRMINFLLNSRTTIGEYQPHELMEHRQRRPIGEPIKNYYPAVIDEETYYRAQNATRSRLTTRRGRPSRAMNNLFTGLIHDARNGATFVVANKGAREGDLLLINNDQTRGMGSFPTVPLRSFEVAFLEAVSELKVRDILPTDIVPADIDEQIAATEAKLADLDEQIRQLQTSATGRNVAAVIELLSMRQAERDSTAADLDRLKAEQHQTVAETLSNTKRAIELLAQASDENRSEIRERVRSAIRNLVADVWLIVVAKTRNEKVILAEIRFTAGGSRVLYLRTQSSRLVDSSTHPSHMAGSVSELTGEARLMWCQMAEGFLKANTGENEADILREVLPTFALGLNLAKS